VGKEAKINNQPRSGGTLRTTDDASPLRGSGGAVVRWAADISPLRGRGRRFVQPQPV